MLCPSQKASQSQERRPLPPSLLLPARNDTPLVTTVVTQNRRGSVNLHHISSPVTRLWSMNTMKETIKCEIVYLLFRHKTVEGGMSPWTLRDRQSLHRSPPGRSHTTRVQDVRRSPPPLLPWAWPPDGSLDALAPSHRSHLQADTTNDNNEVWSIQLIRKF